MFVSVCLGWIVAESSRFLEGVYRIGSSKISFSPLSVFWLLFEMVGNVNADSSRLKQIAEIRCCWSCSFRLLVVAFLSHLLATTFRLLLLSVWCPSY